MVKTTDLCLILRELRDFHQDTKTQLEDIKAEISNTKARLEEAKCKIATVEDRNQNVEEVFTDVLKSHQN